MVPMLVDRLRLLAQVPVVRGAELSEWMSSDAEAERSQAVGFIMLMLVNSVYWAEGKHDPEDFQIVGGQIGLVAGWGSRCHGSVPVRSRSPP